MPFWRVGSELPPTLPPRCTIFSRLPRVLFTEIEPQPKGRESDISALNAVIEALNLAKEVSSIVPAEAVFASVSVILAMIRVSFLPVFVDRLQTEIHPGQDTMVDRADYIELGLACTDVRTALNQGLNGKRLNNSVREAINRFTT